ncbi:MAG TPA: TlpA disulfide reductase family protein [Candidatus Sulfopaludibacter sp.]|nr:TlpA disulfide reductase family protein [Candidatus Sulfopaludibacter sp.]
MRKLLIPLTCALALAASDQLRRAPGFALPDSQMQVVDLADYRGKVVVLEFMQTTCPHCESFAGVLQEVAQKYAGRVQILSVVKAPEDTAVTVKQFAEKYKVGYPILFDAGQMAYSYLRAPKLVFPHIYLIDGNGYIHNDWIYDLTTRDVFEGRALFTAIDRLLAESTPRKK